MAYRDEVLADSPNGYWRLGESSGTAAVSEVNNGTMEGVYQNTPTLGVTGALAGDSNTAVTFASASGEWMSVADTALLDLGDVFTYELWIKRASIGTRGILLSKDDFAQSPGMIYLETGNTILCRGGGDTVMTSTQTITDTTTWHYVVWTKNGATNALYLDGADITPTVTDHTCVSNAQNFCVASRNGVETFDGTMDEVAVYPTALSAARVLAHYQAATLSGLAWIKA